MLRKLLGIAAFSSLLAHIPLAQPVGCAALSFSLQNFDPCTNVLRLNNLAAECFSQVNLSLSEGVFFTWNANMAGGWIVSQTGPTELALTQANGLFPPGLYFLEVMWKGEIIEIEKFVKQ